MRFRGLALGLALFSVIVPAPLEAQTPVGKPSQPAKIPAKRRPPMDAGHLVEFTNSPFPYSGDIPEQNEPFLTADPDGRKFHVSPRGGKLYVDTTYNDRRSLLFVPPAFDPRKAGASIVLFLHGNLATLGDVETRQGVPRQLVASHLNAVLVAPQLAVRALDSSPGRFYEPGFFEAYLREAASHIAERSGHRLKAEDIDQLPVIVVAYSGGYLATAFSLHYALRDGHSRIKGIILLDALFGEERKFQDWILREHSGTFFVSAYSNAAAPLNGQLRAALQAQGLDVETSVSGPIRPGAVIFQPALGSGHNDFVTQAWTKDPLAALLRDVAAGAAR